MIKLWVDAKDRSYRNLLEKVKKMTRKEFLKFIGVSGASFFGSGLLLHEEVFADVASREDSGSENEDIISVTSYIKPDVIHLGSDGRFCSILSVPEAYNIADVDVSSVRCEGAPPLETIFPLNDRSIIFLYNTRDLRDELPSGFAVKFTVSGFFFNGTPFEGSDTVAGIRKNQCIVYHTSARKRRACNACKKHALNKIFSSRETADACRAHPGCNCGIVAEKINWRNYVGTFWPTSKGGTAVYDKRWGWPPPLPKGICLDLGKKNEKPIF